MIETQKNYYKLPFVFFYKDFSMEKLFIDSTKSSPFVYYSEKNSSLLIKGNSYPNNIDDFYLPIFAWLKEYLASETNTLTIDFRFGYYNTSSTKAVINIISICNDFINENDGQQPRVQINWFFLEEDENTREDGEELALLAHFPFTLVEIDE